MEIIITTRLIFDGEVEPDEEKASELIQEALEEADWDSIKAESPCVLVEGWQKCRPV